MKFDVLLAGGAGDPSIASLRAFAEQQGLSVLPVIHSASEEPCVTFDLASSEVCVESEPCAATAAFCRFDVFADMQGGVYTPSNRSNDWHAFVSGIVQAIPGIKVLNANARNLSGMKLADLAKAKAIGLAIPRTLVSNDFDQLSKLIGGQEWIAKPVGGGSYSYPLEDVLDESLVKNNRLPNPAIVQERLSYPEYRVYRVKSHVEVFKIESQMLDYRADQNAKMVYQHQSVLPSDVRLKLIKLGDECGLDFYACDLKSRQNSGELCFLEINSSPMFAAHDHVSNGAVSKAILSSLLGKVLQS